LVDHPALGIRSYCRIHKAEGHKLAMNLFALYEFSKKMAAEFKGRITFWEFGNEEDSGDNAAPWDYATALKVSYLGIKAGNPDAQVMNGAFCVRPGHFHRILFQSDAGLYMDIFNHHIYSSLKQFAPTLEELYTFQKEFGIYGMPLWLTENGCVDEGPGKLNSFYGQAGVRVKEHDQDQQRLIAEFCPKAMTLFQSLGVDKYFYFILHPKNEQDYTKVWGLTNWDYSVKAQYVSYANHTRRLEDARYLGEWNPESGVRGYLYEMPDKSRTLVIWAESELDKTVGEKYDMKTLFTRELVIPAAGAKMRCYDIMGRECSIRPMEKGLAMTIDRYPRYVENLVGIEPQKKALVKPIYRRDVSQYEPGIVTRILLSEGFKNTGTGPNAVPVTSQAVNEICLDVFNFTDRVQEGSISNVGDGVLTGIPEKITLPPFSRLHFRAKLKFTKGSNEIVITGTFNGKKITRLTVNLFCSVYLKSKELTEFTQPANWQPDAIEKAVTRITYDNKEKALCLYHDFTKSAPGNYWTSPVFKFKDSELAGVKMLSWEVRLVQKSGTTKYPFPNTFWMAWNNQDGSITRYAATLESASSEWKTMFFPLDERDAPKIRRIMFGMGAVDPEMTFWLRNFKLYY